MPAIKRNEAITLIQHCGFTAAADVAMTAYIRARLSSHALFTEYGRGAMAAAEGKPCPCANCTGQNLNSPELHAEGATEALDNLKEIHS